LPRIAQSDSAGGYLTEALIAAIAQHSDEAKARLKAFREERVPKTIRDRRLRPINRPRRRGARGD
jgi:hypothetical protein